MGIASLRAHAADLCVLAKAPPLTAADNDSSFISTQIPVGALASPGNTPSVNMTIFGDPILWNTTFQYHFMEYFWPEREAHCLTKNVTGQTDRQDWGWCTESDRCRRWRDRSAWVRGARWCWRWRNATGWRGGRRKGGYSTSCAK